MRISSYVVGCYHIYTQEKRQIFQIILKIFKKGARRWAWGANKRRIGDCEWLAKSFAFASFFPPSSLFQQAALTIF
jgi:hypothetical protein